MKNKDLDMKNEEFSSKENDKDKSNYDEIQQALYFMLSKELEQKSLEEKKDYLKTKISKESIEEASKMLPIVQKLVSLEKKNIANSTDNSSKFLDYLKGFSIYSSLIFATLGINYLLDLTRNKKNEVFYRNVNNKLNQEISSLSNNITKNVYEEMNNYVKKEEFSEMYKLQSKEASLNRGLSLNPLPQNTKLQVKQLKDDVDEIKLKVEKLTSSIENNKIFIKQEVMKECEKMIDSKNELLLKSINNEQKEFLFKINSLLSSNLEKINKMVMINTNNSNSINILENNKKLNNYNDISNENNQDYLTNEKDENQTQNEMFNLNLNENKSEIKKSSSLKKLNSIDSNEISMLLETILSNITEENTKSVFLNGVKNQFLSFLQETDIEILKNSNINLSNPIYKLVNQKENISKFLLESGFKKQSELKYSVENREILENSLNIVSKYLN